MATAVFLVATGSTYALRKPLEQLPPDFDHRMAPARSALADARVATTKRVLDRFGPDVRVEWGNLSDRPQYLFRPGGVLGIVPGGDRVAAVESFLASAPEVFGLSPDEIDALEVAKVYETPSAGLTHLIFVQRVAGVPVFRGQVRVNLDSRGGVVNVGGEYFPGLSAPEPAEVEPPQALATAARGIGLSGSVPATIESEGGPERVTRFAAGGEYGSPPEARLELLPEGPSSARLVWDVTVHEAVTGADNLYRTLVDARTGETVLRERLTLYVAPPDDATGKVFDCSDPDLCNQAVMSLAGDPIASPENWVTSDQTFSQGNNVACRIDPSGHDPGGTDVMADGGSQLDFSFRFRNAYAKNGNWQADSDPAITNAFFWGNFIHDYWYDRGFDEPAGNYQDDNFGLGGVGGDHVNLDVEDAANTFTRNNANWYPTNDGTPPRTNYFLWTSPDRDGAFDATVIWHEFGHGLSTRLVGGPGMQCLSGTQGGGMGEGWSDWVAVNFFSGPNDDPAGPVIVGEYVTGDSVRGIRRYPYSYDMATDPLTYADLCDNGSCEVHDEGEIWATVLWDMRHDLITTLGYDEGRRRAELLVIDGMKLSPCSPNFVTMRDSILQADEQRYGGDDLCVLRSAFARRGLGAGAASVGTGRNATADFSLILPYEGSLGWGSGKTTLGWQGRADAASYTVARGAFGPDAAANAFDDAACVGDVATPAFEATESPAVGNGFYYLVSLDNGCVATGYGAGSDGSMRAVTCP